MSSRLLTLDVMLATMEQRVSSAQLLDSPLSALQPEPQLAWDASPLDEVHSAGCCLRSHTHTHTHTLAYVSSLVLVPDAEKHMSSAQLLDSHLSTAQPAPHSLSSTPRSPTGCAKQPCWQQFMLAVHEQPRDSTETCTWTLLKQSPALSACYACRSRLDKETGKLPPWLSHWRLKLALSSPLLFQVCSRSAHAVLHIALAGVIPARLRVCMQNEWAPACCSVLCIAADLDCWLKPILLEQLSEITLTHCRSCG